MSRPGQRHATQGELRKSRQGRKAAKQARRREREPRTELDRLLDDPHGLEKADPLMAEIAASAAISWWREFADEGETREGFVSAVISGFGQKATSNGLAMLHAMVPMLYPKLRLPKRERDRILGPVRPLRAV